MSRLLCRLHLHDYQPSNVLPAFRRCARGCGAVRHVGPVLRFGR